MAKKVEKLGIATLQKERNRDQLEQYKQKYGSLEGTPVQKKTPAKIKI